MAPNSFSSTLVAMPPAAAPAFTARPPSPPTFRVRSYAATDKKTVWAIFSEGMMVYQPSIEQDPEYHESYRVYPQKCFDSDLGHIDETYFKPGGHFWVVTARNAATRRREIAGIVGLENKGDGLGELRRLAVSAKYRRHGLGEKLVRHVEQWATDHGFTAFQLNTDCVMAPALRLYDRLGYTKTHEVTKRVEPPYYHVWFRKELGKA